MIPSPTELRVLETIKQRLARSNGSTMVASIRPGSRVTILTPQGQQRTGRVVMSCRAGGWVLNLGGRHGTPGIADESNIVAVNGKRI